MEEMLDALKAQYGNVWIVSIGIESFVIRELRRQEYYDLISRNYKDEYEMEETICKVGTVYPIGYGFEDTGNAGVAKNLSQQIMLQSGFSDPTQQVELLNYYRGEMSVFDRQAEAVISLVFPQIDEKDMFEWTQEEFMRRVAKAEWVMREIWQMPFAFSDGSETEDEEEDIEEEPTLEELGYKIREEGGDPMVQLKSRIIDRPDKDYVEFPFIAGPKLLENEEVLDIVREQIQRLPKR